MNAPRKMTGPVLSLLIGGCQLAPVISGLIAGSLPDQPVPQAAEPGMQLLGSNPWAARQRTATGRQIHAVEYLDGQVYVGFGDWRGNTGPIAVTSWDVATRAWVHHFGAATESIERFHPLRDGMLLPYTDPADAADLAWGPAWRESLASDTRREAFAHVFAAAETPAGIFLVGTRRRTGEPLVRQWDGQQWRQSLLLPGQDWLWFAAVLHDELHVQSEKQGTFRFDGSHWHSAEPLFINPRARSVVSLAGRVAGITRQAGAGQLQTSNGLEHSLEPQADAWDLNLDQATGWAYLLRNDSLQRSRDLLTWETVPVKVPPGASALDVADGQAWIGTADSRLWVVDLPSGS